MRTSPGFCGTKGSVFPVRVLWRWISAIGARSSLSAIEETLDCIWKGAGGESKEVAKWEALECRSRSPWGVLQVWQAKELRERVFGSVANTGVTGEILEVWQGKDLADFWRKAGNGCGAQKRTARRGRMVVDRAREE